MTPKVRVESQLSLTLCNPPNISAQRPLLMLWTAPPPAHRCHGCGVRLTLPRGGAKHAEVTTIGLDIAKSVFQVHGIDAEGNVLFAVS